VDRVRVLNGKIAGLWTLLVVLFVLTPLVTVIFVSLSAAQYISFPWDEGWSLQWFTQIPEQSQFLQGAQHSIEVALVAAVVGVVIGTLAAIAITRYSFPGRTLVVMLGSSPLFVPEVMLGVALVLAISQVRMTSPFLELLLGHIVIILPFVLRVISASLADFSLDQENAAMNLGATRLRALLRVTFPQVRSGIVAAAVMAFIVSFDNISVSLFVAPPGYEMLPVTLYSYAQNSFDGIAAAVSVAMIGISLVGIVILDLVVGLDKLFGGNAT
jgi:putative spermidine/putrescine transport system permease protein